MPKIHFLIDILFFLIRKIFGPIVRFLWIKEVSGFENIPKTGSLIVALNHESYFDFFCFIAIFPRNIHFLAAEKFFDKLSWKILMITTGQIKVDRKKRDKRSVHEVVASHLKENQVLGIFPEGTRSIDRENLLKAYPGVVKYAIINKVPVLPVGIIGTFDIMSRNDIRPSFKKIVRINIGKPILFEKYYPYKMNKKAYNLLIQSVMLEISKLSHKKYPYEFNPRS